MDKRDQVIVKLYNIALKQQEMLKKMAQNQGYIPTELTPDAGAVNEADVIMAAMDPETRTCVSDVWVTSDNIVKVKFHPGKSTDKAWNGVQDAIKLAQSQNKLHAQTYQVQEVM